MTFVAHVTETVAVGEVDIFLRRFGKDRRTPVLIVHGLSFFSYDWIGTAEALGADREVVAIDMRGFGNSSVSLAGNYKLDAISADVIAVMDHLGWQKAILMGHSFGGRVSLATAGWKPERAAAVILLDFAPDIAAPGRRRTAESIGLQPEAFASVDVALAYHGHANVAEDSPLRARYEAFLRKTDRGYVLRRDLHFRNNFKKALDTGEPAPVPAFLWPMLGELRVPTLVVRGSRSDMFAPETLTMVRKANPRVAAVEIEGGHDLAGENEAGLVACVQEFLSTNHL